MEEVQGWMRKAEEDRNNNREEFKSLLMDLQHKVVCGSGDRGPGPPLFGSESVQFSTEERLLNPSREGPLLPTPPQF